MAQKMLQTMKTIAEIVCMPWYPEIGEELFTVIGTVGGVQEEGGWFYATCSQCSKNLAVVNGAFWCSICNGSSLYPMVRFRIHLRVQDESGEGLLTLYNQQAEHLLDTCAKKLLNRLGIGSDGFPDEIGTLTGRAFVFSIRMPDYFNPDYDYHQHRVVRLYEIDPVPPVSLPPNRPTKVKRKKSRAGVAVMGRDEVPNSETQPCASSESTCVGGNVLVNEYPRGPV